MIPHRPVAKSCNNEPLFFDPPHVIQKSMGGSQWFFEIGAKFIHRVGVMTGLGWVLPVGESGRGINYVRVTHRNSTYDMFFGTRRDMREDLPVGQGIINPFSIVEVAHIQGVSRENLRATYDQETMK